MAHMKATQGSVEHALKSRPVPTITVNNMTPAHKSTLVNLTSRRKGKDLFMLAKRRIQTTNAIDRFLSSRPYQHTVRMATDEDEVPAQLIEKIFAIPRGQRTLEDLLLVLDWLRERTTLFAGFDSGEGHVIVTITMKVHAITCVEQLCI